MLIANNAIRLKEIQMYLAIWNLSQLQQLTECLRNKRCMKELYEVPFEQNSERVKKICHHYDAGKTCLLKGGRFVTGVHTRMTMLAVMHAACKSCSRVMQKMDLTVQERLSPLHYKGWDLLGCRWKYVARQTGTSACARMIYVQSQYCILFTSVHSSTKRVFLMLVLNKWL